MRSNHFNQGFFFECLFCCALLLQLLSPPSAQGQQRQLPPCRLDSFVHQAGSAAEAIYGDEGVRTPPPFFGFGQKNRIASGFFGTRDQGLTTGHGSHMPSAWGADEFVSPPGEWCESGPVPTNGRNVYSGATDNSYDVSEQLLSLETGIEAIRKRIAAANDNISTLRSLLASLSPADKAGQQALAKEVDRLVTERNQMLLNLQIAEQEAANNFGKKTGGS